MTENIEPESEQAPDWQFEFSQLKAKHIELEERLALLEQGHKHSLNSFNAHAEKSKLNVNQLKATQSTQHLKLENLIGLQGFSWLGIFALVTGLGFFIRFAYLEGWLGPIAILACGFAFGLALLGLGEWIGRKETYRTWANALMGGGIAGWYFLAYAAYHFEYFRRVTQLSLAVDVFLLIAIVGLAIFLAMRKKSQSLASRAFLLGFVTSLFSRELILLTLVYQLLLSLGLSSVVAVCRWNWLASVGVIATYFLHGFWLAQNESESLLGLSVSVFYFALFSGVSFWLWQFQEQTNELKEFDPSAPLKLEFTSSPQQIASLNLTGFTGLMFIGLDRLSLFSSMILWAIWLGVVAVQHVWLYRKNRLHSAQGLLASEWVVAILMCQGILTHFLPQSATYLHWLLWGLLALPVAQLCLKQRYILFYASFMYISLASLVIYLAQALPNTGISIAWALLACAWVAAGFVRQQSLLRYQGLGLLLLTGIKVFVMDLSGLNMAWKIISLLVLGTLLLAVAFVYTRQHARSKAESEDSLTL